MNDNLYPIQKDPNTDDQNYNNSSEPNGKGAVVEQVQNDEKTKESITLSVGSVTPKDSVEEEGERRLKTSTETINDLEDITESYMEDTAF
jgi:hypothetical protein